MRIDWPTESGELAAIEATLPDVERYAETLADGYNDPRNAELMGHGDVISPGEVVASYAERIAEGARAFLLFRDSQLVGDADLRHLRDGAAEFAFMVGSPAQQRKGLGTRFAIMIHAFGFSHVGLHHIYASIVERNVASRRVFDKLGYIVDHGPTARGFADEPDDIVMALDRPTFEHRHGGVLSAMRISTT